MADESLHRFMDPALAGRVALILGQLADDILRALDAGTPAWVRLRSICRLVDEQAGPPGPDDHQFAGGFPPAPGTPAAGLCALVLRVREVLIASDLQPQQRLDLIGELAAQVPDTVLT